MAQAVFYVNGIQKYSGNIGDSLVFDIPGYTNIWLTQYQNGVLQYDGPEALPTAPLQLTDPPDLGTFQGTAYEVINGQKGAQIASWTFQINPAASGGQLPTGTGTGGNPTCTSGLCTGTASTGGGTSGNAGTTVNVTNTGGGTSGGTVDTGGGTPGGGLSPFGNLPGSLQTATTTSTGQGPGTGTSGISGPTASTTAFNLSGFIQSPLFWLLLVLLALVYFMSE